HGVLKHLQSEFQVLSRLPARVALSAQIEIVGLQILSRLDRHRFEFFRRKGYAQGLSDLASHLVLHFEDVFHLAIEAFRPERKIRPRVDQLRIDAKPVSSASQRTRQYAACSKLLADLRRRDCLIAKRKDRGTREDIQSADL